jgi:hypothetical protein
MKAEDMNRVFFSFITSVSYFVKHMEVSSPPGTVIGSIEQQWSILTPQFHIKNAAGDVVLKIEGPICTFSICGDVEFKVGFLIFLSACFLIGEDVSCHSLEHWHMTVSFPSYKIGIFFSLLLHLHKLWGPHSFFSSGYLPRAKVARV